ncbi:hypothetical protein GCM10029978_111020 [Actinoallomurus acanthiterrae]
MRFAAEGRVMSPAVRMCAALAVAPVMFAAVGCGPSRHQVAPSSRAASDPDTMVLRAEAVLTSQCMSAHHFRYWVPPERHRTAAVDGPQRFPFVVDDVAWARANGYGESSGITDAERGRITRNDPNVRYVGSLSPSGRRAYELALNGPPPSAGGGLSVRVPNGYTLRTSDRGCVAEARGRLYGDLPTWFRAQAVVDNLWPQISAMVRADPAFRSATRRWAACMRGAGHPYDSPDRIRDRLGRLVPGGDAAAEHRAEVRLAVAEAGCARRSGLGPVSRRLDRTYTAAVDTRFQGAIETLRRLRATALTRARGLIR